MNDHSANGGPHPSSQSSGGQSRARPDDPVTGNPQVDLTEMVQTAEEALRAALVDYAPQMPTGLIAMGKFALSGPGKLLSLDLAALQVSGAPVVLPRWPLQVLLSCQAAGLPDPNAWRGAIPAAIAVEIAIAAADLIDELTDDDPSPFIAEYGRGQALNTGNLMLVIAQQVLSRAAARGDDRALAALGALQDMLVEAAGGQHLDMLFESMGTTEVTLEMSQQMTEMKAGALISGAYRAGALMAGAGPELVDLLARLGRELGSIAQLRNDIQDVLPAEDVEQAGSPQTESLAAPKTDLKQRKRTIPIVFALRDDAPEPNDVQRAFGGQESGVSEEEMRDAVVAAGGVRFAMLVSEVHRQKALETLAEIEALRPGASQILSFLLPGDPGEDG